jgi:hypothetical protein
MIYGPCCLWELQSDNASDNKTLTDADDAESVFVQPFYWMPESKTSLRINCRDQNLFIDPAVFEVATKLFG